MGRGGPRDGTAVRNLAAELESLSLAAEQTPELDREPVTVCAPSSRIDGHYEPQRVFGHYCGYSRRASPARRRARAAASSGGTAARAAVVRRVPPPPPQFAGDGRESPVHYGSTCAVCASRPSSARGTVGPGSRICAT